MAAGRRLGRLVALERGPDYVSPKGRTRERWWFDCDCGERVLMQAHNAVYDARNGWGCCPTCIYCIRAAGEPPARVHGSW